MNFKNGNAAMVLGAVLLTTTLVTGCGNKTALPAPAEICVALGPVKVHSGRGGSYEYQDCLKTRIACPEQFELVTTEGNLGVTVLACRFKGPAL